MSKSSIATGACVVVQVWENLSKLSQAYPVSGNKGGS
jgi:hypothetical protein